VQALIEMHDAIAEIPDFEEVLALARTQQCSTAREPVGVIHRISAQRRCGSPVRRQIGAFTQRLANETKNRAGGEIRFGFADDQLPQLVTCRVKPGTSAFHAMIRQPASGGMS
jgi:hypothetical protein